MSKNRLEDEPSMEEILASIRRIIAEDEEAAGHQPTVTDPDSENHAATEAPNGATGYYAEAVTQGEAGVLELTEMVAADGSIVTIDPVVPDDDEAEDAAVPQSEASYGADPLATRVQRRFDTQARAAHEHLVERDDEFEAAARDALLHESGAEIDTSQTDGEESGAVPVKTYSTKDYLPEEYLARTEMPEAEQSEEEPSGEALPERSAGQSEDNRDMADVGAEVRTESVDGQPGGEAEMPDSDTFGSDEVPFGPDDAFIAGEAEIVAGYDEVDVADLAVDPGDDIYGAPVTGSEFEGAPPTGAVYESTPQTDADQAEAGADDTPSDDTEPENRTIARDEDVRLPAGTRDSQALRDLGDALASRAATAEDAGSSRPDDERDRPSGPVLDPLPPLGSAFAELAGGELPDTSSVPVDEDDEYAETESALEDLIRQAVQPMLREWLDETLPDLVERIVQQEIKKLIERRGGI